MFICSFVHLFICSFVHLFICLFVYLSICLFVYLFICLFVYLFICLFVYLSVCLFVCLFIYLFIYDGEHSHPLLQFNIEQGLNRVFLEVVIKLCCFCKSNIIKRTCGTTFNLGSQKDEIVLPFPKQMKNNLYSFNLRSTQLFSLTNQPSGQTDPICCRTPPPP